MTLRIQRYEQKNYVVFVLSGRIDAEQVAELNALLQSESPDSQLALDLKEVKLVDRDAVQFLAEIEDEGAELLNRSAFIREWISQERQRRNRTDTDEQRAESAKD